jgi:oxygen-independent coproporphyrinogen-3 oxidase
LEKYVSGAPLQKTNVSRTTALEEAFFLGLRLTRGVDLRALGDRFGTNTLEAPRANVEDLVAQGLLQRSGDRIFLTSRGRLLSNEVFQLFIAPIDTREHDCERSVQRS